MQKLVSIRCIIRAGNGVPLNINAIRSKFIKINSTFCWYVLSQRLPLASGKAQPRRDFICCLIKTRKRHLVLSPSLSSCWWQEGILVSLTHSMAMLFCRINVHLGGGLSKNGTSRASQVKYFKMHTCTKPLHVQNLCIIGSIRYCHSQISCLWTRSGPMVHCLGRDLKSAKARGIGDFSYNLIRILTILAEGQFVYSASILQQTPDRVAHSQCNTSEFSSSRDLDDIWNVW